MELELASHQEVKKRLDEQRQELEKQLETAKQTLGDAERKYDQQIGENKTLNSTLKELQVFVNSGGIKLYKTTLSAIAQNQTAIENAQQEITELESRIAGHESNIKTHEEQIRVLAGQCSTVEKRLAESEAVRQQIEDGIAGVEEEKGREDAKLARIASQQRAIHAELKDFIKTSAPEKELLQRLQTFIESGDLEFMKSFDSPIEPLVADLESLEKKFRNKLDIKGADRYAEALSKGESADQIKQQITDLAQQIIDSDMARNRLAEKQAGLKDRITSLEISGIYYDRSLAQFFDKFRVAARDFKIEPDCPSRVEAEIQKTLSQLRQSSKASDIDAQQIEGQLDTMLEYISSLDLGKISERNRHLKNSIKESKQALGDQITKGISNKIIPNDDLIIDNLRKAQKNEDVALFAALAGQFETILNSKEEDYARIDKDEERLRKGFGNNLTSLLAQANLNIGTLRSVLRDYEQDGSAFFDVSVHKVSQNEVAHVMENIIDTVKKRHKAFVQRTEGVLNLSWQEMKQEEKGLFEDLRAIVRKDLYRNIFLRPEVKFVHPAVRSGDPTFY